MIFLFFSFLSFQIVPISPQLNIMGIDFLTLLPDSETEIFLNPSYLFFWDKKFLFSLSSYHPYLYLNDGSPVSFQNLLSAKIGKDNYSINFAYHYLFSYEKREEKMNFFNYHNLPFLIGYNLGEIKLGLGTGYQQFYFKKRDTLKQDFVEEQKYLPFKFSFLKGEEERLEIVSEFITCDSSNLTGYQLKFSMRKILGNLEKHIILLETDHQKRSFNRNWKFICGYCLSSYYNFYGFIFNNFFSVKSVIFFDEKGDRKLEIIFPFAFISSFGKVKFLYGLKNRLIFSKESAYFAGYEYNFGLNYQPTNNLNIYFFNLPVNKVRKWYFTIKVSF